MSAPGGPVRRAVAALVPVGHPSQPTAEGVRRLNLNECPYPPSPAVIAALVAAAGRVNRYPDARGRALAGALAERLGVAVARIALGNGSDALIRLIGEVCLDAGDAIVVPAPSFGSYATAARVRDAEVTEVALAPGGAVDAGGLIAAVGPRTRIVFAANPNNPTGALVSGDELAALAEGVPERVLLVLDEAYFEFARHAGGADGLGALAGRRGPWVVLRTFSKAYALAGARIGYAICGDPALAQALDAARPTFFVNALAQAAALAALGDQAYAAELQRRNARDRERLAAGLAALGLDPMPSVTNFVAAALCRPAAPVIAALARRGILIAPIRAPGWEHFIRVSVGAPDDTDALLAALAEVLGEAGDGAR